MTSTLLTGIFQPALGGYSSNDVGPRPWLGMVWGNSRLPTDPIGTCTRTFDGVPAGSEIRVFRADGVELAGVESCLTANPQLSWPVYAPGANSVNRIVIVNLAYEIKEFPYTPSVGTGSIPVQMGNDGWYSNPA